MAAFLRIGAKNAPRQSARVGRRDCITLGALLIGALMSVALFVPRDVAASPSEVPEEKGVGDKADVPASLPEVTEEKDVVDKSDALLAERATALAEELSGGDRTSHLRKQVEKAIADEERAGKRARKNMIATTSLIGLATLLGIGSVGVDYAAAKRSDVKTGFASGKNLSKAGDGMMYASAGVFAAALVALVSLYGTSARVFGQNAKKHMLQEQLQKAMEEESGSGQQ